MVIFSVKTIVGPQEAQDPRFWLPWTMAHYILGSICFWTPPTPPIWLETQKCAFLSTFSESRGKKPYQCRGPPWKILHWKCSHLFFYGLLYMLGLCHFIFATFSNEKVFTITVTVTVTGVQWTFWNLAKNWKIIFSNYIIFDKIFFIKHISKSRY